MKLNSLKLLLATAFLSFSVAPVAYAAAEKEPNLDANVDVSDKVSLARGAKYYSNFCMGCHSLGFSRYNRVAADLGLEEADIKPLIFTRDDDDKIHIWLPLVYHPSLELAIGGALGKLNQCTVTSSAFA